MIHVGGGDVSNVHALASVAGPCFARSAGLPIIDVGGAQRSPNVPAASKGESQAAWQSSQQDRILTSKPSASGRCQEHPDVDGNAVPHRLNDEAVTRWGDHMIRASKLRLDDSAGKSAGIQAGCDGHVQREGRDLHGRGGKGEILSDTADPHAGRVTIASHRSCDQTTTPQDRESYRFG